MGDLGGVTGKANDIAEEEADIQERTEMPVGVVSPWPLGAPAPERPGERRTRGLSSGSIMYRSSEEMSVIKCNDSWDLSMRKNFSAVVAERRERVKKGIHLSESIQVKVYINPSVLWGDKKGRKLTHLS